MFIPLSQKAISNERECVLVSVLLLSRDTMVKAMLTKKHLIVDLLIFSEV